MTSEPPKSPYEGLHEGRLAALLHHAKAHHWSLVADWLDRLDPPVRAYYEAELAAAGLSRPKDNSPCVP